MKQFGVRAVLFDLDGTLVDSIPDLAAATQSMLRELGEPSRTIDEVKSFVGKGIPHLVRLALCDGRVAKSEAQIDAAVVVFQRHYKHANGMSSRLYEGAREVLSGLRRQQIKIGCVTNKSAAFTEPLLAMMGLSSLIDVVVAGDTLPQKKPSPEPLLHACAQLGVSLSECLMVGDSANDALAARNAGIPVLLVRYGYSEGQPVDTIECDGLLSSLAELPSLLQPVRSTQIL